jgi:hypothetical protein
MLVLYTGATSWSPTRIFRFETGPESPRFLSFLDMRIALNALNALNASSIFAYFSFSALLVFVPSKKGLLEFDNAKQDYFHTPTICCAIILISLLSRSNT